MLHRQRRDRPIRSTVEDTARGRVPWRGRTLGPFPGRHCHPPRLSWRKFDKANKSVRLIDEVMVCSGGGGGGDGGGCVVVVGCGLWIFAPFENERRNGWMAHKTMTSTILFDDCSHFSSRLTEFPTTIRHRNDEQRSITSLVPYSCMIA